MAVSLLYNPTPLESYPIEIKEVEVQTEKEETRKFSERAEKLAEAIVHLETGGNCHARGQSGETGCFQFMSSTWRLWSERVFGYVAPQTSENEMYVALTKIQYHIDEGYSDGEIALIWNQGNPSSCKSGVNRFGVPYDSCAYKAKILAYLNQ